MRILYHHRTLGDGAEGIHVREMVKAFRAVGHEVKVIGPVGEATAAARSWKSKLFGGIKRLIPSVLFEFVEIAYSAYSFILTTVEIRRFRPDFIYDRYITFNAGTVLAGKVNGVGVLLEVNAPLALERSEQKDERLWLKGTARAMERWICANAATTVVVSSPLKDYLESIGVPQGKCFVMPNGADPANFIPRPKDPALLASLGIPEGAFVIGFTGVLRAWHGLDLLMEAFAALVQRRLDVVLLIVGDGSYRGTLESHAARLGVAQFVRVTGRIAHERVADQVALFDVAVSPRATFYASPMKVLEYMALGKPVVVPRTPNFTDMVDERDNGLMFTDGDPVSLAEALAALYSARDLCRQLGNRAREKVETRLNWRWNAVKSCDLMRVQSAES